MIDEETRPTPQAVPSMGDEEQHGGGQALCTAGGRGAGYQTVINKLL